MEDRKSLRKEAFRIELLEARKMPNGELRLLIKNTNPKPWQPRLTELFFDKKDQNRIREVLGLR